MAQASRASSTPAPHGRAVGRYLMFGQIGFGGTATVHVGRLRGAAGFGRTVALKRLHAHLAQDPYFVALFLAEARTAARVSHPNVVPLLDVVRMEGRELLLVMEYVHGETLAALLTAARRRGVPLSPGIVVAIMSGALAGLHAAHEAKDDHGAPLGLVHGDVSPSNIIVGVDGTARVLDFGVARASATRDRRVIGTLAYMAPERLRGERADRRSDVFGAGVVLWEMLSLSRLFRGSGGRLGAGAPAEVPPPSRFNPCVPAALDKVVQQAARLVQAERPATAQVCAAALEQSCPPASVREVAAWVEEVCGTRLQTRALKLARIEAVSSADWGIEQAGPRASPVNQLLTEEERPERGGRELCDTTVAEARGRGAAPPWQLPTPARGEAAPARRPGISTRLPVVEDLAGDPPQGPPMAPAASSESTTRGAVAPAVSVIAGERFPYRRVALGGLRLRPSVLIALGGFAGLVGVVALRSPSAVRVPQPLTGPGATQNLVHQASAQASHRVSIERWPLPAPIRAAASPSPAEFADDPPPGSAPRAPTPPSDHQAVGRRLVADLDRRALAAYERLDLQPALRLLSQALRRCERPALARSELAARTHLALGVVLAGGFKQPGLAARHFRLAHRLQPDLAPPPRLLTPDISRALAQSLGASADTELPSPRR